MLEICSSIASQETKDGLLTLDMKLMNSAQIAEYDVGSYRAKYSLALQHSPGTEPLCESDWGRSRWARMAFYALHGGSRLIPISE